MIFFLFHHILYIYTKNYTCNDQYIKEQLCHYLSNTTTLRMVHQWVCLFVCFSEFQFFKVKNTCTGTGSSFALSPSSIIHIIACSLGHLKNGHLMSDTSRVCITMAITRRPDEVNIFTVAIHIKKCHKMDA